MCGYQYDYLPPDGQMAVEGGDRVIPVVHRLMDEGKWDLIIASQVSKVSPELNCNTIHIDADLPPPRTTTLPSLYVARSPTLSPHSPPPPRR